VVDALFEDGSEVIPTSVGCKHSAFQSATVPTVRGALFLPLSSVNSLGFNSDIEFSQSEIITEAAAE
jgi:hypothetical protein